MRQQGATKWPIECSGGRAYVCARCLAGGEDRRPLWDGDLLAVDRERYFRMRPGILGCCGGKSRAVSRGAGDPQPQQRRHAIGACKPTP